MGKTASQMLRVLLVDDDQDDFLLTQLLVTEINQGGIELAWAADRDALLAHIDRLAGDVVLMDYHLGEYSGVELIHELTVAGSEIPIVLLTGAGTRAIDLAAMAGGAVDYLDRDELTSTTLERSLRYAVERARLRGRERDANQHYRSLVEHLPAAFFISASDDYVCRTYVSPQMVSLLDSDDSDDTPSLDRVHVDDRPIVALKVLNCNATGEPSSISYRLHKRDGSLIWVREEAVLVHDQSGKPMHWHGVVYDITAQKQAEAELRESNDALERSNRALQEFASVASHDLKAPLVSIQGLARMLQADCYDTLEGDGQLYVDRIIANAGKLRGLLDDLLDLSRVGNDEGDITQVDLTSIITDVTDQLRQRLDERGASVEIDGCLPSVSARRVSMRQVFANLIDNAVQYTPPTRAPHITISATDRGDAWEIAVRDNGAGIAPESRDTVFVMFQRLPSGASLNPTGTGMGLAIVARIIEATGGRCWIGASDSTGTIVCLTVPKHEATVVTPTTEAS